MLRMIIALAWVMIVGLKCYVVGRSSCSRLAVYRFEWLKWNRCVYLYILFGVSSTNDDTIDGSQLFDAPTLSHTNKFIIGLLNISNNGNSFIG